MDVRGRSRRRSGQTTRSNTRSSKRSRSSMSVGTNLFADERLLAVQHEKKNIDATPGFPTFGVATATLALLNGCAQGTTALTRLGRRITMKSLYVRAHFELAPTSTGSTPIRLLVVYDKQANATAPGATDVLDADVIGSMNNLSNSRRFVTLMDHLIPCIGTAGPQAVVAVLYKKLNHVVEFNAGSAGTIADIQSGSVYMLAYTANTIGTASIVNGLRTRIRFTDN